MSRTPQFLRYAWPGLLMLSPGLDAQAKVYMTREQALTRAFPDAASFLERKHLLSEDERGRLQKALGRKITERGYFTYLALDADGEPLGFAVVTAEIGKHEPFLLLIATAPDGQVTDLELIEYREPRGGEIERRSYLDRYRGIDLASFRERIRRIPVIPGATLSCNGVGRAVAKVLCLHAIYVDGRGDAPPAARLGRIFDAARTRKIEPEREAPGDEDRREKVGFRRSLGLPAMGDVCRIELSEDADPAELRGAMTVVEGLEAALSLHHPGSLVARANALPIGGSLALEAWPGLVEPLRRAFAGAARTGGRFSPVPSRAHPEHAFRIAPDGTKVRRIGPGDLDAGGFGKGLAADHLADELDRRGLRWTSVGFGSSFLVRMQDGARVALATTGSARRGAHIRDPRRGVLVHRTGDAQVVARSAFEAEIWSTAEFVEPSRRA